MSSEQLFSAEFLERVDAPRHSAIAYEAIREAILSGRIKPGEWLRQERLAQELNMTQVAIREALARLIAEGLAVREPRKGVRTALPGLGELEEIYRMRAALEGLAMEMAATRISSEDLSRMRELLPKTAIGADADKLESAREANREFHWIAIQASGGKHLTRVLRQLLDMSLAYFLYVGHEIEVSAEDDLNAHKLLIGALEARDGVRAKEVVTEHINTVIAALRNWNIE